MSCPVTHPTSLAQDLRPTKGSAHAEAGMLVCPPVGFDTQQTDSLAIRLQIYMIFIFAQTFSAKTPIVSQKSCTFSLEFQQKT